MEKLRHQVVDCFPNFLIYEASPLKRQSVDVSCLPVMRCGQKLPVVVEVGTGALREASWSVVLLCLVQTAQRATRSPGLASPAATHPQVTAFCIFLSN